MDSEVFRTNSGIFVRIDPEIGAFTYSPFNGNCYLTAESLREQLIDWLQMTSEVFPSEEHLFALGPGWFIPIEHAKYPVFNLLPTDHWSNRTVNIRRPILINWMITGNCPLECTYCYAEDLMRSRVKEPDSDDIVRITDAILELDPVVVVLTGGDPLASPHLDLAMSRLSEKTGILFDTSGVGLKDGHIDLFLKYNVYIRVSLDAENPGQNNRVRKFYKTKSTNPGRSNFHALNTICKLLDSGLNVGVQTVVTKHSWSDLESLGDKLFKLGVSSWRILLLVETKSNQGNITDLLGKKKKPDRFTSSLMGRLQRKYLDDWNKRMTVHFASNSSPNNVVVVGPNGVFYTESNVPFGGKVILDQKHPTSPSFDSFRSNVNTHAHVERYLNIFWGRK